VKAFDDIISSKLTRSITDWDSRLIDGNKPVVLFGAGDTGIEFCKTLLSRGVTSLSFCDNVKFGQELLGFPVISPAQIQKNSYVAVSSRLYESEIKRQLLENRIVTEDNIIPGAYFYYTAHADGYRRVIDLFEDDFSKALVIDRMNYLLTGEPLRKNTSQTQYFDSEIIRLGNNEVFVDGGGYDGGTSMEFIRFTRNQYTAIYVFEPSAYWHQIASDSLASYKNVSVLRKGLWDKTGTLQFQEQNCVGDGRIGDGPTSVSLQVISIDDFFDTPPLIHTPTFIKLDIEGSEKAALSGAKNTISMLHPKLAVCAYHKNEDFYILPELIKQLDHGYKLFLRHYTDSLYESVIYAI
jgi:FkbM family methyltransferase